MTLKDQGRNPKYTYMYLEISRKQL